MREPDLDLKVLEMVGDRRRLHIQSVIVAHAALRRGGLASVKLDQGGDLGELPGAVILSKR